MAKTMIASVRPMTDGQLENAVAKFRDALRKHRGEFSSDAVQQVLGVENLGMELLAPFRTHVEAISGIIVRRATVNRTRTPQEVIDAAGRMQYIDENALATMPQGEGDEVDVHFVPTERFIRANEVSAFLAQYGLVPDPRAQAAVHEADPAFADGRPNVTQWGNNCYLMFGRWHDERRVHCSRYGRDWEVGWFLSGVPASRK